MKRTGRFYRRNEAEVMRSLGLEPTPNSGSGWVAKEDGSSDHVLAQLKSTDHASIGIKKKDIETLEHNASVEHKIPVFVIQYLSDGKTYLLVSPDTLQELARYLGNGSAPEARVDFATVPEDAAHDTEVHCRKVKGGGRHEYLRRREIEKDAKKRSARL